MSTQEEGQPFKRLNFFRGLVTYYTDWIDHERYRNGKRHWHAQRCHAPGVVSDYADELAVVARGDLSIEVLPGCAVDGLGRELISWETQIKRIPMERLQLPCTVYICARLREEMVDFVAYKQNSARGHKRVLEGCEITVTSLPPEPNKDVELGRVLLERGVRAVTNAADPSAPRANEVDLRFVLRAGRAGAMLEPLTRRSLDTLLIEGRHALAQLSRRAKVNAARDALHQMIAMAVLHAADLADLHALEASFATLLELQIAIYVEIKHQHPALVRLPQFSEWVRQLREMQKTLRDRLPPSRRLVALIGIQQLLNQLVTAMLTSLGSS